MSVASISRRMALGVVLSAAFAAGIAAAQVDELAGIPNVERLTEQQQATYRRRLRDASGDQERAQIREEARMQAQNRIQPQQGSGQGASGDPGGGGQGGGGQGGGGQGTGRGQGADGGQDSGGGGGGQAPRRIPGSGGGRSN